MVHNLSFRPAARDILPAREPPSSPFRGHPGSPLNLPVEPVSHKIHYQIDSETNDLRVQVLNAKTGEVVRQIPLHSPIPLQDRIASSRGNHLIDAIV